MAAELEGSAGFALESDSEDLESLPEPLLRFVETFDFKAYVQECVVPAEDVTVADRVLQSAHMLGQSRNGEILFSWDHENGDGELITVVGVYSPRGKSHKIVYLHDTVADFCNASINAEKTLLAFTVKEPAYETDQTMYDSFIAEIQPQGRVFTLNIPTPDFRSLQFIQTSSHASPKGRLMGRNAQTLTSHLLVVIPQVLISLYHFRMQQIMLGAVMLDHPKQEIIHKNFAWYQWDPHTQWLYYARFEGMSSKASMSGKHALMLNCENFSVASHPLLFTISLPLPYSENLYSSVSTYYDSPFLFVLPIREMNLQVLYRRDGFWCACLQHCTGKPIDQADSDGGSSEGRKIDYSVYVIHNGHTLYGQVPLTEVSSRPMYIHFMLVGCFVAAYIPDVMLHLLNVGPQVDPCHHLTFGSDYSPFAVADAVSAGMEEEEHGSGTNSIVESIPCLATATSGSLAGDYDPAVVDCDRGTIYECTLNIPAFFSLFKSCNETVLKEDLLHLMVVGFRHHGTALSMIEHICQTPLAMWDHRLFAEFIISSSYANVYFDCKKFFARQLPLTTARTYHGKVSKYQDGGNRALLKVTQIPNFVKQLLVQSDQSLVMATPEELLNYDPTRSQPFESLCFNAVLSQPNYHRLELNGLPSLNDVQHSAAESSSGGTRQQKAGKKATTGSSSGILSKIATFGRKSGNYASPTRSSHDPLSMLTFLGRDKDMEESLTLEASMVREQLVASLTRGLPLRSRNTAYNMVATYYNELQKQCCSLLLVIWQSLGFNSDNHPLNNSLCRSPTTKEKIFFELLEAYQLALLDLNLPLPMGFQTLFISMGYLTLDKIQFLQYLRNGVFTPTKKFVELLLEGCDEERDTRVIFQVICNLDYTLAEFAFSNWRDPTVQRMEQPSNRSDKHGHGLL
jgi:hypothetical protein